MLGMIESDEIAMLHKAMNKAAQEYPEHFPGSVFATISDEAEVEIYVHKEIAPLQFALVHVVTYDGELL